jgi:UMF1 family MFS transporter
VTSAAGALWLRRPVLGWALYDWANSAFALSVMTTFVPVLLAGYWNDGAAASVTTFRLGLANGMASLAVALSAPLLGALADRSGRRTAWLLRITALAVLATAALWLVAAGGWVVALVLYALASVAFGAANALYDSLLVDVAAPAELDRVSAYGYGLGYLGGALLFTLNVALVARPDLVGFASADEAVRFAFLTVAAWWLVFSIPLALTVRDDPEREGGPGALVAGFGELRATLRAVRQHADLWRFLVAYWLYIDAVYTIIKMAVDYGLALGLTTQDLIQAILITNFVAFPAALAFGRLAALTGPRTGICVGLAVYIGATIAAGFVRTEGQFYALAVTVGLVQGGVQSLSRSFFARLVPEGQAAEYFGFFNMVGKFAAIIGPVLTGVVALASGSERLGILSLLVLFVAGAWLLVRVREPARSGGGSAGASA